MKDENFNQIVSLIWSLADTLRGYYRPHQYGSIILPFVVLRRLDQSIQPTRAEVAKVWSQVEKMPSIQLKEARLKQASKLNFYNISSFATNMVEPHKTALEKAKENRDGLLSNIEAFINGFCIEPGIAKQKNAPLTITAIFVNYFNFSSTLSKLHEYKLLYRLLEQLTSSDLDLSLDKVSNIQMGYIFEELIRKFSEQSNETAGEHFTPREVIRLMVDLLIKEDPQLKENPNVHRTIYDPACGTGGMLSLADNYIKEMNYGKTYLFGQELNPESYAICASDMLIKGYDVENIKLGNTFDNDQHKEATFHYMLSNPPFGVDWSKAADGEMGVKNEHETKGFNGRFGPGLPRKSDGSLLFVLHMLSKMKKSSDKDLGSRIAIVLNGSPLFSGAAGSGESEIRRHLLENDFLEAIIALPDQMFYNTGISTYIWIISNNKSENRRGKVQLINAVNYFQKMRKSLGDKRKEISDEDRAKITKLYADFTESDDVKIFDNQAFGFHRVTVERPLRLNFQITEERLALLNDQTAWNKLATSKKREGKDRDKAVKEGELLQKEILTCLRSLSASLFKNRVAFSKLLKTAFKEKKLKISSAVFKSILTALSEQDETADVCVYESGANKGNIEPDSSLRDYENIPLTQEIDEYMAREVLPHVPDAWVDASKTKVGYEIPFTRHFYVYEPPRPLAVIESEILSLEGDLRGLLSEVFR
jgi:type I restriction enzyme M protein